MTSISSRPFRVTRLRLLTPAAVAVFADQVPRGQWVPLDQFSTLLIDRLAESVEFFLPSRSTKVWRRLASTSRQLTLLTHLNTHLEALFVVTHCRLISIFTSRLSCRAGTFVVGSRCRLISSFVSRLAAVAPSLTQAVVCSIRCHCVSCHSLHAALLGCLLTLTLFSSLLDLVELAAPPGLWFAFWNCCT